MVFLSTVLNPSNLLTIAKNAVSARNLDRRTFCFVIKTGTFLRCVVWPLFPPLLLYQFIRQKDEDLFALELLRHRAGSDEVAAFYDSAMPKGAEHWRMQADLKLIKESVFKTG